jgi:hypothetical protein
MRTERLGFILLAVWLILQGMISLLGLTFDGLNLLMGLIALVAGLAILLYNVRTTARRRR